MAMASAGMELVSVIVSAWVLVLEDSIVSQTHFGVEATGIIHFIIHITPLIVRLALTHSLVLTAHGTALIVIILTVVIMTVSVVLGIIITQIITIATSHRV